jgi:uncharacterized protein YdiU (UPF0061 family)
MRRKIGLASEQEGDAELISALFAAMQAAGADFTLTFRRLARCVDEPADDASLSELFARPLVSRKTLGLAAWRKRLAREPQNGAERAAFMRRVNPAFIPRNPPGGGGARRAFDAPGLRAFTSSDTFSSIRTTIAWLALSSSSRRRRRNACLRTYCGT